ncbi:MAG: hypothetical protein R2705_01150 [Ilumatobacteraceae bacterium]
MIDESAMATPLTAFAASKLHQEHLVDCFTSERGLVGTSLRLQNVYGSDVPVGPTAAACTRCSAGTCRRVAGPGFPKTAASAGTSSTWTTPPAP